MKILKKSAILLLAILMLFSTLVGCGETPDDNPDNSGTNGEPNTPVVTDTENYLIRDGLSDYKLVIETDGTDSKGYEAYAAQEIKANVELASGVILPVVETSEVVVSKESKLIVIGENSLSNAANVKADKNEYGVRGFVVKTIDSNVYIVGGDTMGTLYGAYEFLHYQFGYEPYASDEIALETAVTNKKLMDFDLKEIPDIAHMQATYEYWGFENRMAGHRMRFNEHDEIFVAGDNQPWHNTFAMYANPSEYASSHPKWFTEDLRQIHYTCHGDKAELKALQDLVFEKMVGYIEDDFRAGKQYEMIGFMAQDGMNTWAKEDAYDGDGIGTQYDSEGNIIDDDNVDSVAEYKRIYGDAYASAMLIHFINPIQERITEYMNENHDGKKMQITIFAYVEAETPPTKVENGKQVPIVDTVVLHPDVNVFIAPIYADYLYDFDESTIKSMAEGWKVICKNSSFWFYEYYFSTNSFTHLDSTYSMQTYFQACKEMGATYIFYETPLRFKNYYAFGKLKTYMMSKLGWDVNADVNKIIDDFFTNYYKDAAEPMREYFDSLTAYFALLREKDNPRISGVCGGSGIDAIGFWEQGVLEQWLKMFDDAYAAIEPIKNTNKALYDTLYDRICYDSLAPRYLIMKHYAEAAFTDASLAAELAQFKADAARIGVERASDHIVIANLNFTR